MNCLHTAVNDFRPRRKHFSISGSLLLLLLLLVQLLVTQTSARPSDETPAINKSADGKHNDNSNVGHRSHLSDDDNVDGIGADEISVDDTTFMADDEYGNIDNIEWHHVKVIDGVMHEDHPVIMYKEDFVSEDYDPSKSESHSVDTNAPKEPQLKRLRYAVNSTEDNKYHALKPEKVYFDLPQTPIVVVDDGSSSHADTKFDPSKIRVEVISLLDNADNQNIEGSEVPTKRLLSKRPKKFLRRHHRHRKNHQQQQQQQGQEGENQEQQQHNRQRRDLSNQQKKSESDVGVVRSKRTPHIRAQSGYFYEQNLPSYGYYAPKHSVVGKKWNGIDDSVPEIISIGPRVRLDGEKVIWGTRRTNHRATTTTKKPAVEYPPIFHIPDESNDNNFNRNPDPIWTRPSTERPQRRPSNSVEPQESTISHCTLAIVNCCTGQNRAVRYRCFENFNCIGSFWDLNPCADNVLDAAIDFVGNFED